MARRSKQPTTSPNKVLVIFLVIFILLTLVFSGWVYMQARDKDNWDTAAKNKAEELQTARKEGEFATYQLNELQAAIGYEEFLKNPNDLNTWKQNRERYKDADPEFRKFIKEVLEKQLDGFDGDGYKTKYVNLRGPLESQLKDISTKYATEVQKNNAAQQQLKTLQKENADAIKKLGDAIKKGNDDALAARLNKTKEMTDVIDQNKELRDQIAKDNANIAELTSSNAKNVAQLDQLKKKLGGMPAVVLAVATSRPPAGQRFLSTRCCWISPRANRCGTRCAAKSSASTTPPRRSLSTRAPATALSPA